MPRKTAPLPAATRRVSLKMLAEYLDLSPATVSFVLNNAPGRSIPPATRERVKAAAKKFGYQPSLIARSLQGLRTQTIGILLPELGEGYHSQVLSGAADVLMQEGYFFFTAHHRHRKDLVAEYPRLLQARGVDGILAIDTQLEAALPAPTVSVAGHSAVPGVTNVISTTIARLSSRSVTCTVSVTARSPTCTASPSAPTRRLAGSRPCR